MEHIPQALTVLSLRPPQAVVPWVMAPPDEVRDPFDPSVATAPTRRVPVIRVVDLLHLTHAPETVEQYAAAMAAGQRFPPIAVFPLFGRLIISDGHKRFSACKSLGVDHITVELWGVRRLAKDLWRQARAHTAGAFAAMSQLFRGAEGRRQARAFVARTLAHWRRTAVSLLSLLWRP